MSITKALQKIGEVDQEKLGADTVEKVGAVRADLAQNWAKYLFIFTLGLLAAFLAYALAATAAFAQDGGGGGDAIQSTLANVRDYISALLLFLGGIGFVASLGVKSVAGVNENVHAASHMGMKGSAIAVIAGAIVNPIMSIIQGLAAGGGG